MYWQIYMKSLYDTELVYYVEDLANKKKKKVKKHSCIDLKAVWGNWVRLNMLKKKISLISQQYIFFLFIYLFLVIRPGSVNKIKIKKSVKISFFLTSP